MDGEEYFENGIKKLPEQPVFIYMGRRGPILELNKDQSFRKISEHFWEFWSVKSYPQE